MTVISSSYISSITTVYIHYLCCPSLLVRTRLSLAAETTYLWHRSCLMSPLLMLLTSDAALDAVNLRQRAGPNKIDIAQPEMFSTLVAEFCRPFYTYQVFIYHLEFTFWSQFA